MTKRRKSTTLTDLTLADGKVDKTLHNPSDAGTDVQRGSDTGAQHVPMSGPITPTGKRLMANLDGSMLSEISTASATIAAIEREARDRQHMADLSMLQEANEKRMAAAALADQLAEALRPLADAEHRATVDWDKVRAALASDGLTVTTTEAAKTGEAVLRLPNENFSLRHEPTEDEYRWCIAINAKGYRVGCGETAAAAITAALEDER